MAKFPSFFIVLYVIFVIIHLVVFYCSANIYNFSGFYLDAVSVVGLVLQYCVF